MATERPKAKRWLRLALYLVLLTLVSFGFAYLLGHLMTYLKIPAETLAPVAYLIVFGVALACNAAILVPVALHVSIMMWAVEYCGCDIILVVLVASVGGTLGEITGYYAGYLGKRIVHLESAPGYDRLVGWMKRYGPLGIFLISLQPLSDIAGLLAGVSKLPLWKFLLPCWPAKFLKYLFVCYLGGAVLDLFPRLPI